ncbi:MAG: DJ-1/PfpI family protein [Lachnospiraceae bacterium]|nr:DJ-1/PfpI family protein [Lachnospiraceae bacterium]
MEKVYAYLADGFEEVECLAVVDVIRRGGVACETVAIAKNPLVTGAHGVMVAADRIGGEVPDDATMLFLPGGMPGTNNLYADKEFMGRFKDAAKRGVKIAAICAAPMILGQLGLLNKKKATCYPGFEDKLVGAILTDEDVVVDGNVITGRGMGVAVDMGLAMLEALTDKATAQKVKNSIMHPDREK